MFSFIARLLGLKSRKAPEVRDSVLGVMRWNDGVKGWQATVEPGGTPFQISMAGQAGEPRPDDRLVRKARAMLRDYAGFDRRLGEFLASEADRLRDKPRLVREIRALAIDCIYLLDPARPDDAQVYFVENDGGHLWRCDIEEGKPARLLHG